MEYGRVGSPCVGASIGHVDFMLFVSFLIAMSTRRKHGFQWNTGLILIHADEDVPIIDKSSRLGGNVHDKGYLNLYYREKSRIY